MGCGSSTDGLPFWSISRRRGNPLFYVPKRIYCTNGGFSTSMLICWRVGYTMIYILYIHMYILYICTHTHIYVYKYMYINIYIYTYIYTHTQATENLEIHQQHTAVSPNGDIGKKLRTRREFMLFRELSNLHYRYYKRRYWIYANLGIVSIEKCSRNWC